MRSLTVLGKFWSSDEIMACRGPIREWYDGPGRQTMIASEEGGQEPRISFCLSPARTQGELHTASSYQRACNVLC